MSYENIAIPNPEDIPSMTPGQLLALDNYAVVRYVDDEPAWMEANFVTQNAAFVFATHLNEDTEKDHRVVRIEHAN